MKLPAIALSQSLSSSPAAPPAQQGNPASLAGRKLLLQPAVLPQSRREALFPGRHQPSLPPLPGSGRRSQAPAYAASGRVPADRHRAVVSGAPARQPLPPLPGGQGRSVLAAAQSPASLPPALSVAQAGRARLSAVLDSRLASGAVEMLEAKRRFAAMETRFLTRADDPQGYFGLGPDELYVKSEGKDNQTQFISVYSPQKWEFRSIYKHQVDIALPKGASGRYFASDIQLLQVQALLSRFPELAQKMKIPEVIAHFSVNNPDTLHAMQDCARGRPGMPQDKDGYRLVSGVLIPARPGGADGSRPVQQKVDAAAQFFCTQNGRHLVNMARALGCAIDQLQRGGPDDDIYLCRLGSQSR